MDGVRRNRFSTAAIERGDSAALASLYDADAAVMPEGMNAARHDRIQSTFGGMLSQFAVSNFSLHTQNLVASGDLAVETGRYAWTLTPKKGKAMTDSGKYVVAWRKQADGSWKLYRDIFNDDAPPPAKR
jgi:ketosteroid isomerase-like protein